MPTEKKQHIGLGQRLMRSFNPVIIFEDRPYTWHSDVDLSAGDLVHVDVEGDAIDNDHLKYVGHETDRGVEDVKNFKHAVAGPVKNGKLIISKDKRSGEQSDHVGVYTLATKAEFDAMKPKVKKQVTCENFLVHVGAITAFEAAANDADGEIHRPGTPDDGPEDLPLLPAGPDLEEGQTDFDAPEDDVEPTEPLKLTADQRIGVMNVPDHGIDTPGHADFDTPAAPGQD